MINTMKTARVAIVCAFSMGLAAPVLAQTTTAELDAAYGAQGELLPPNAKPGECYARVYIPATTRKVAKEVLVKEATEKLEVIEAVYETIEETVEIEGPSEELEIIPAEFKTETKTVIIEPEREVKETVEAVYEVIEEKVKIREAYTTWKKGEGPIQRYDEATGEIMCLVTIPAEFEVVTKNVVKTPPRTQTNVIPAKTEVVEVKVMVTPPSTKTVKIPAKTKTISIQKLVTPASVKTIKIPAQFETVYETVKESAGQMEWRPILCSTNASEDLIKRTQIALREAGYNPGTIDGVLGGGTMESIRRYQRANGLAQGQVTIETLDKLGVSVR